jgi:hypothetical protein
MRKRGFLVRTAAKKYAVNDKPRTAATVSESKPKETKPVLDTYVEVLLGEIESINKRLEDLLLIKVHLINRLNAYKDATARSARSR